MLHDQGSVQKVSNALVGGKQFVTNNIKFPLTKSVTSLTAESLDIPK